MRRAGFLHIVDGRSFAPHDGMIPLSTIEFFKRESIPVDDLDQYVILIHATGLERIVRLKDVAKQLPLGYSVLSTFSSPTTSRVRIGRTQFASLPIPSRKN